MELAKEGHGCVADNRSRGEEKMFISQGDVRTSSWPGERNATPRLAAPLLLLPSIQTNIRAGKLQEAKSNGVRYLEASSETRRARALKLRIQG